MPPCRAILARRQRGLTRLLGAFALTAMGCVLIWRLLEFLDRACWAMLNPHELDYGEGIVWQQMRMIVDGRGYAPLKIFPAIVFHYPPVYHVLTWVVASVSGVGDLVAGRALSFLSTLSAAALVGVIAGLITTESGRAPRWICGATAGLVSLTCYPVAVWSALMRVDMVAVALSLGGLCLSMLALRKPILIYLAAIAFVGAVFTKQTMLAAPGAAFLVLIVLKPGLAVRGISACVVLGLVILCGLSIATHGEFTHHIFAYNINRFSLSRLRDVVHIVHQHIIYLLAGAIGLGLCVWQLIREAQSETPTYLRKRLSTDVEAVRLCIAIAYVVAATCMLILVGKSGAGINYYVEWFLAGSVFVGAGVRNAAYPLLHQAVGKASVAVSFAFILIPLLVAAGAFITPHVKKVDHVKTAEDQAQLTTLIRQIKESGRPVISDNMVILREAGKEVEFEPSIVAELTSTKVYDERPLLRMIHNKAFAFFVTDGERGERNFDSRYSPAVAAAIYQDYPRVQKMAGLIVHLPEVSPVALRD
jgi:hypothetical protein